LESPSLEEEIQQLGLPGIKRGRRERHVRIGHREVGTDFSVSESESRRDDDFEGARSGKKTAEVRLLIH
jgi:hypothetical protein